MNNTNCCWLCQSTAIKINEIEEPIYYHCPTCDLIFIDKQFLIKPEAEKDRYELHNNTIENEGYVNFLQKFIDNAIKPLDMDFNNGLDFGCGPSPVLSMLLSQTGIKMDWYDPFFYPQKSYLNKKYDLITATEVLEHVHQPRSVLEVLSNHLQPNGILALMTQFHSDHNFKTWWYRRDNTHVCFYSVKTFLWIESNFNLKLILTDNSSICVLQAN